MSHELTITPHGHLQVREVPDDGSLAVPKSLLEAYTSGIAEGTIHSVTLEQMLPLSFSYARSLGRLYLVEFARAIVESAAGKIPDISPPDLTVMVRQAPPMIGQEYLTAETLAYWWRSLDDWVRSESAQHAEGATGWLRQHHPAWRQVGRVTLHLAENKCDSEYPFAFLATFANGLTPQGRVRHEPLGRALEQYSGAKNRKAMLNLLTPVAKAAETVTWLHDLVESGDIYQPLAWTPAEAHAFLKSVPQLEAGGLMVRVPDWWSVREPPRPRVNVTVNSGTTSGINVDALLDFKVELSLDGEALSQREIADLLGAGSGLVSLRGRWVEVDAEKLEQALRHWKGVEESVREEGLTFFEGMRLLSGTASVVDEKDETPSTVQEWTGLTAGPALTAVLDALRSPEASSPPPGLRTQLRPYQRIGLGWLRFLTGLGLGACLADDMGLGKTVQVIALLLDWKRGPRRGSALLVVPASLIANWKSELARFAPDLRFTVAHSSEPDSATLTADSLAGYDVVITTYGMLARTSWLLQPRWRLVILDEAQAVRNSGTKQARASKTLKADARIALTGTPVENRLSDLWSLFDFLNPGLLGGPKPFAAFVKRLQQTDPPSFAPLRRLVQPYILRRMKTDKRIIADLPEKTEVEAWCTLSKHQAALYQHAVDDLAGQLKSTSGIARRGLVLAQLMRLKQICNHPSQALGTRDFEPDRSGKFRRLAEIVGEIAERQEKLLVFSQFREMTGPLAAFLATVFHAEGLVLHGGTTVKQRKSIVDQFQREDGPPFLVLSLKAGGTGLNLTAASHVIHFDRWWNPAVENQATDRAFRIGQKQNVLVHKFICRGTLEERIDALIREKSRMAGAIVGETGGEALLTEMDDETLLHFVRLELTSAAAD